MSRRHTAVTMLGLDFKGSSIREKAEKVANNSKELEIVHPETGSKGVIGIVLGAAGETNPLDSIEDDTDIHKLANKIFEETSELQDNENISNHITLHTVLNVV